MYRARQKSNPLGKILYLWNYRRFFHQIYSVYRRVLRPHVLQILLKLEIWGRAQREAARGVRKQALINF